MFKEYRLTIFALLVFAVMIAFGISSAAKQRAKAGERIEIPLSPENTSEQILIRKGYTVSYNKDNKIPNWVSYCLCCRIQYSLSELISVRMCFQEKEVFQSFLQP